MPSNVEKAGNGAGHEANKKKKKLQDFYTLTLLYTFHHTFTHALNELVEQFSSLLSLHPEYALIFHECQHTGVSCRSPVTTFSAMNGNSNYNNSQSMKVTDDTMTSYDSHVINRVMLQDAPSVCVCTPLRPRSKEQCNIHSELAKV